MGFSDAFNEWNDGGNREELEAYASYLQKFEELLC